MKLEVGMYVRTDKGNICKIIDYHNDITDYFYACYETDLKESLSKNYLIEENILKASHNIIDLIEVGDIIKFDITDTDNYAEIQGYNCLEISCEEELNGVKEMIEMESAKLLSIVTKEQFKSISYEVSK